MRTVIYGPPAGFTKQSKITDPAKAVTAWLNSLPGSTQEGKQVKEIVYFQIVKDGMLWQAFALVELE